MAPIHNQVAALSVDGDSMSETPWPSGIGAVFEELSSGRAFNLQFASLVYEMPPIAGDHVPRADPDIHKNAPACISPSFTSPNVMGPIQFLQRSHCIEPFAVTRKSVELTNGRIKIRISISARADCSLGIRK